MSATQAEELTIFPQRQNVPMSSQDESYLELTMSTQEECFTMSSQEESFTVMSTQEESVLELPPNQQTPTRPSCRVQYRLRWFYSKGAFLILIWLLLTSGILDNRDISVFLTGDGRLYYLILLPAITEFVSALVSGWLADAQLGNYRTLKAGAVLLFFSMTLFCALLLLLQSVVPSDSELFAILLTICSCLSFAGRMPILVISLQLGLDQMPDASSDNIISFISWFVLCLVTGFWLNTAFVTLVQACTSQHDILLYYFEIWSLLAVLCTSIILISDFLLAPKWLTKEPKSPQSLKGIFKVLRYAKNHKYPVQRSALTFWEEELPSRIDFGKSKYGGPFTTEQVENVKTTLRMLVVSIPMWVVFTSNYIMQEFPTTLNTSNGTEITDCSTAVVKLFTSNSNWWLIVGILINEFTIYPFVRKSPTILKRFGVASFILILVSSAYLILNIVSLDYTIEDPMGWSNIVQSIMIGLQKMVLLTSALEFVCAQSPLNMRNLSIGYILCINYLLYALSNALVYVFGRLCASSYCTIIYYSLATVLSVVGFVLHCFLARWYKRRKREDVIATQQWVEEAYDRYLRAGDRHY